MDGQDITIEQASKILNVSARDVVQVLDEGQIPYHTIGSERQIRMSDLMEYKKERDAQRRDAMEELYRVSEAAGLYAIDKFPPREEE
ncbi:helix-turn-helix domain-containing protein [Alicyclobacillus ferrooxydans]|uniref:helix-turn-helix domain-containing protein n=1 Tax=Alicyclobacillus ferrooxydans TaxID=471514 RepID=UPI0006D590CC|nr:helix-turn-helix domain-containing protein [Alicyclobacillus ferrooxydans]